jgi:ribose transport system permease protein
VVDTSRVLSAQASTGDVSLTFAVLAGIVVGGTSILGGEGAVWRTVVGVLFIALIGNGYLLLSFDPLYEQITMGALLLAAVGLGALSRRRR